MKLYTHLELSHANKIITLANRGLSRYKISQETGVSKGKIERCLEKCEKIVKRKNLKEPWKDDHKKISYSFKVYKDIRDQEKMNKAFEQAEEAEKIYQPFVDFCENYYNKKILNRKVKKSANEYIKEFKKQFPNGDYPGKSWIYKMANSPHYKFRIKWLPSSKIKRYSLKSDDERKKAVKYTSIEKRPPKEELRDGEDNYENDSVVGKRTDNQALLTLMNICNGLFYSRFYNRTMKGYKEAMEYLIKKFNLNINTLTMDNGGENNLLGEIIPKEKMFNCHPYCSGEKGTLENKHRLVRRIFKKGESLDGYTNEDLEGVNKFVNNYFSKKFNKL